jgi:hypothetical protein
MDGRINNAGTKGNKGGNPGHGRLEFIREKVSQYSELWWTEWEAMMNSKPDEFINNNVKEILKDLVARGDKYTAKEILEGLAKGAFYRKQFAMSEFNKIQIKMIPTDVTSGGDKLPGTVMVKFLQDDKPNGQSSDNRDTPRI